MIMKHENLQEKTTYENYLMLDKLDSLKELQGNYEMENLNFNCKIPFGMQHIWYGIQLLGHGTPKPIKIGDDSTYINVCNIQSLHMCNEKFSCSYSRTFPNKKGEISEILESLSGFTVSELTTDQLEESSLTLTDEELTLSYKELMQRLIGVNIRVYLKINNDWIKEIVSLTCKITDVNMKYKNIVIEGTGGLYLEMNGFKNLKCHKNYIKITIPCKKSDQEYTLILFKADLDVRSIK